MYSDLFDALGGGAGGGMGRAPEEDVQTTAAANAILSFKAGKVKLTKKENSNAYKAEPDPARYQVYVKYNSNNKLSWVWFDRRERCIMNDLTFTKPAKLLPVIKAGSKPPADESKTDDGDKEMKEESGAAEESKEPEESKKDDGEEESKMYYWMTEHNTYFMFWLQDKNEDPELITKLNDILKNPTKPSSPSAAAPVARSPGNTSTSSSSTTRQVDALSNILENLGMPQGESQNASGEGAAAASAAAAPEGAPRGTLTLADFQGAMAGLQAQQQGASTPGLQEIVSPEAINSLLENEEVCNRLIQELPPDQRSKEFLEENLRSPQVQQTLRSLTLALMPDDNGSMEGYHSVLANFQLDPTAGQRALQASGNPIQAFLDCVLDCVKKEKDTEESKDEEMKDEETKDEEMKE